MAGPDGVRPVLSLRVVVSARDAGIIERVLAAAAGDGKPDRGESPAEIRRFDEEHKSEEG